MNDLPYRGKLDPIYRYLTNQPEQPGQQQPDKMLRKNGGGVHAGLWLDKYIGGQDREDAESKRLLIEQVSRIPIPEMYQHIYDRWFRLLTEDYEAETREARVRGRMIVGLGEESVLETSVTLSRTYGVPYIPGSALKGLAAHYANLRAADAGWREGGTQYNLVFGTTKEEGSIIFFDALYMKDTGPNGQPLHPDIITVHHHEYYQGQNEAPADWDNPTPIPFLSVAGKYLIALAAPTLPDSTEWINATFTILEGALDEIGIGAKTSSGYGRMQLLQPGKTAYNRRKNKRQS